MDVTKDILELLNKNKKILDQYYDGYREEDFKDLAYDLNTLFAQLRRVNIEFQVSFRRI